MTTRLHLNGPRSNVNVAPTAARTTAPPARPFRQLMQASAGAIVATAEQAATRLPGGPILAAALRSSSGQPTLPGSHAAPTGPAGTSDPALTGSVLSGSTPAGGLDSVLARNSDDNFRFLELQERISHESRTFTALSNVLKARHETVKNAISNIR